MGHMRHHAIIVSGEIPEKIPPCHSMAKLFFGIGSVSDILTSPTNGVLSFLVAPDGSKEGWAESDEGDEQRDDFVHYLNSLRYEDGSSPVSWVEVMYGDDYGESSVIRHSKDAL